MLNSWIKHLSSPRPELGGFSICPFAKNSQFEVIETNGDIQIPDKEFSLIIFKLPDYYTIEQLDELAKKHNKLYPKLIFLPDHKDRETYISGVKTNNSKYNLLLCQPRADLESARAKLKNTNYYSFWNKDYLDEILGT